MLVSNVSLGICENLRIAKFDTDLHAFRPSSSFVLLVRCFGFEPYGNTDSSDRLFYRGMSESATKQPKKCGCRKTNLLTTTTSSAKSRPNMCIEGGMRQVPNATEMSHTAAKTVAQSEQVI